MMKEKVLILGKGDSARSFFELCRASEIAVTAMESSHDLASHVQNADIITCFLESDGAYLLSSESSKLIRSPKILIAEILSQSLGAVANRMGCHEELVGASFARPFGEKRFIQLISGERTEKEALDKASNFFTGIGFAVAVSKDHPGFILDRVVFSMINEAIYMNMYGLAVMEDIDQMMRLGANFPMGPFEYADTLGLDRVLRTLEWLTDELGSQYRPCPLLRRKVEAGFLGKKTGKGFYTYQ